MVLPQIALSIIIPAYNESSRISDYLSSIKKHFHDNNQSDYEVIIVDDGSTDFTHDLIMRFKKTWPQIGCLKHAKNLGKGAAVRTGVLASKGEYILFADADGSTEIGHEVNFRAIIDNGADIVIGVRKIREGHSVQRSFKRRAIASIFSEMVSLFSKLRFEDTQCGFKMFRQSVGKNLFTLSMNNGYLFDIEILLLAERLGYVIVEQPINWREVEGSKLRLIRDSCSMWLGLINIKKKIEAILLNHERP